MASYLKKRIVLEQLAKVDVVAVGQDGTLTIGRPEVVRIECFTADVADNELLRLGASLERRSNHPLAKAIMGESAGARAFDWLQGTLKWLPVVALWEQLRAAEFWRAMRHSCGRKVPRPPGNIGHGMGSAVYIAADGRALGVIILADRVRPDAKTAIERLKANGVKRVIMLTGDNETTAQLVAAETGIDDEVRANLLPEDKLRVIKALQHEEGMHRRHDR